MYKTKQFAEFHSLWSSCADLPGYNKKNWAHLSFMMDKGVSSKNEDMQDFVLLLAKLYLETHK